MKTCSLDITKLNLYLWAFGTNTANRSDVPLNDKINHLYTKEITQNLSLDLYFRYESNIQH